MHGALGITGTPGTGKKSIAPLVAKELGVPCLGINDFAESTGLLERKGEEAEVDAPRLRRALARRIKGPTVVYGHLLPYVVHRSQVAMAVVLRCEPSVLKARLHARGYSKSKVIENVEAELIGAVTAECLDAFGKAKTFEVDTTTTSPEDASVVVAALAAGGRHRAPGIDWLAGYDSGGKLRSLLPPA
jgi:adenylate kinase